MLSKELKALQTMFGEYTDNGLTMSQEKVRGICGILEAASQDAQELERAQIPSHLRLVHDVQSGGNIVRFPPASRSPRGGVA